MRGEGSRDPPPIPSLSPFTFLYSHGFHFSTPSPPQVLSQPLGPRLPDPGDCGEHLCFKMPLMFLLLSCIPRERPLHLPAWVGGRGRPLGVDLLVHTSPISSCQLCLYFHSFGPRFRLPEPLSSFSYFSTPSSWPAVPHQTCWLSPVQPICVFWIHISARASTSWVPARRRPSVQQPSPPGRGPSPPHPTTTRRYTHIPHPQDSLSCRARQLQGLLGRLP